MGHKRVSKSVVGFILHIREDGQNRIFPHPLTQISKFWKKKFL